MSKALRILCVTLLFVGQLAFALPPGSININSANAEELAAMLAGVGRARAEAIVAYRDANGEFTSVEELLAVRGIGDHVLESNRNKIALDD